MSTGAEKNERSVAGVDITSESVLESLRKILASEDFVSAPRLSSLLNFIVLETLAGRSTELKGFNIANRVFGRDENFDARTDPLVRVQANRLRKALERYYLTSGKQDSIQINVPKGSYAAIFEVTPKTAAQGASVREAPPEPSIAVLPFRDIGKGDMAHVAVGLTEELTTALAQVENFVVIGRHSTMRYLDNQDDLRQVGLDLGVRFVMTGSVQVGSETFRITSQLTDTQTGAQVWSERFDRPIEPDKVFELQDEISATVIARVADAYGVIPRILEKETRGKRTKDLQVYEAMLRFYLYQADPGMETFMHARIGLQQAIERDPDYALAHAALAENYCDNYALKLVEPYDQVNEAFDLARRAIALDPSCQQAHFSLAMCQFHRRERPGCLRALDKVLELNPNAPYYAGAAGWMIALVGDWERGLAIIDESKARNPFVPTWFYVAHFEYHFMNGDFESALSAAESVKLRGLAWDPLVRAAALQRLGRADEASVLIADLLESQPKFAAIAREYLSGYVYEDELAAEIYSALKEAGLP